MARHKQQDRQHPQWAQKPSPMRSSRWQAGHLATAWSSLLGITDLPNGSFTAPSPLRC